MNFLGRRAPSSLRTAAQVLSGPLQADPAGNLAWPCTSEKMGITRLEALHLDGRADAIRTEIASAQRRVSS
jgi:hypothetical protein